MKRETSPKSEFLHTPGVIVLLGGIAHQLTQATHGVSRGGITQEVYGVRCGKIFSSEEVDLPEGKKENEKAIFLAGPEEIRQRSAPICLDCFPSYLSDKPGISTDLSH